MVQIPRVDLSDTESRPNAMLMDVMKKLIGVWTMCVGICMGQMNIAANATFVKIIKRIGRKVAITHLHEQFVKTVSTGFAMTQTGSMMNSKAL